jgi:hypothetical protein
MAQRANFSDCRGEKKTRLVAQPGFFNTITGD